jgi:hypothetical protein
MNFKLMYMYFFSKRLRGSGTVNRYCEREWGICEKWRRGGKPVIGGELKFAYKLPMV